MLFTEYDVMFTKGVKWKCPSYLTVEVRWTPPFLNLSISIFCYFLPNLAFIRMQNAFEFCAFLLDNVMKLITYIIMATKRASSGPSLFIER